MYDKLLCDNIHPNSILFKWHTFCERVLYSDINECMEGENDCVGTCVNTYGSYTCECDGTSPYADHNCRGNILFLIEMRSDTKFPSFNIINSYINITVA